MREGREEGYTFYEETSLTDFIKRVYHDKKLLSELQQFPGWNELKAVELMIEQASELGNEQLTESYGRLKSHIRNRIFNKFREASIEKAGPFHPGKRLDRIAVVVHTGNVYQDLILLLATHEKWSHEKK